VNSRGVKEITGAIPLVVAVEKGAIQGVGADRGSTRMWWQAIRFFWPRRDRIGGQSRLCQPGRQLVAGPHAASRHQSAAGPLVQNRHDGITDAQRALDFAGRHAGRRAVAGRADVAAAPQLMPAPHRRS